MLMCGSVEIALIPYVKHRAKYVYFQQEYNAYKFLYSHNIILKFHLQEEQMGSSRNQSNHDEVLEKTFKDEVRCEGK